MVAFLLGSGKQPCGPFEAATFFKGSAAACPPEKGAQAARADRRSGTTSGFPFSEIYTAKAGGGTRSEQGGRNCPAANES